MFFLDRRPQMIPATSICGSEWLANQVLERIRKRMISVEDALEMGESFRYLRVLLKFSAQKSASSVNF
jgi:hypothetical protein